MAQYRITGLNYMSSGDQRGLLDVNILATYSIGKHVNLLLDETGEIYGKNYLSGICTETGLYKNARTDTITVYPDANLMSSAYTDKAGKNILINERQHVLDVDSLSNGYFSEGNFGNEISNPPMAILVVLESDISTMNEQHDLLKYLEFNTGHRNIHGVYEFERHKDTNIKSVYSYLDTNTTTNPMNDIRDLAIKSSYQKQKINPLVPKNIGQPLSQSSKNKTRDIYMVLKDTPVLFCQYKNDSMILTLNTKYGPMYLNTYFRKNAGYETLDTYSWYLSSDPIDTFLYMTKNDTGNMGLSAYLNMLSRTPEMLVNVFNNRRTLRNIEYNYLITVNQNQYDTIYDEGNIPARFWTGKNMYNSTYSMLMSSENNIGKCRSYCGLLNSNRKIPILKYYDDVSYSKTGNDIIDQDTGMKIANMAKKRINGEKYPYQKVEYVYETTATTQCRHKSTLFSIRIKDSGLETNNQTNSTSHFYEMIRTDINNNIRELVDNVCPANTLLFKVYYES